MSENTIRLAPVPDVPGSEARMPRNVEAEAALIGALMIDNRIVEDVQMELRAEHFFEPLHGRIYEAILKLVDRNMVANPVTLKPLLESDPALKELGGPAYLAQLTGSGAAVIGARDFARQVYDLALLRELVGVGRELVDKALDTSDAIDPKGQIEQAELALYAVAEQGGDTGSMKTFAQATRLAVGMAEKALNSGGHVSGITSGLDGLNNRTGGLHPSDLIIVAGRPGMGKSSLATNIAYNAASRWMRDMADGIPPEKSIGAPVAIFNLEMSADQLATRILAEQSGISGEKLRMGRINHSEFQNLVRASRELQDLPLFIDDTAGLTIAAMRTRARRLKRRHNIGMIVVDYLQLLQGSGKTGDSRVNEISEISRGLKTLAKELMVPVIALSQLSRAVESREDKRPQLSDLRESGSIEQDADMVWFLYREDYYEMSKEPKIEDEGAYAAWREKMDRITGHSELIVAKQRHGATGKVRLYFDSKITRFTDLADDSYAGADDGYE
ncbi:replicative DNA helicase [Sphingobium sp. B1D7B]|uniref:replicative DNA helicase n=1 Tax=Sphingobium TaxID=165695 RepID=UPI0015ECA6E1|nr:MULTISPECIES: replicative DNA helicase [Sphingobium]MCW2351396.1 replicative DNA helicase [Sphingobium sp. B12D2B]MCW2362859.1 replicative DNA helicase [Sphingobium sp. B10D3B]MCW2370617.1 replicative DNA helicase [Sphingobium sp. B11D3D]MCW2392973.1 replicative DNA helicase [Sphingobium sp. B11D3A]MCW2400461.1 replicative DNA helicase [Sphingobium sp. B10D7B]